MSDGAIADVPEGFEPLRIGYGFTDSLKPLYRRVSGSQVNFGLVVQPQHANTMGICHGGALMTLADIAGISWANMARGVVSGAPTVNLSMDFIAAARQGEWIETRQEGVVIKRLFGFSRGVIIGSRGEVARFNATFYFPQHTGMSQDGIIRPGAMQGILDAPGD